MPLMGGDGRMEERVVPREGRSHSLGVLFPKAGTAFNVREEVGMEHVGRIFTNMNQRGDIGIIAS